jgi:hypothetical protein
MADKRLVLHTFLKGWCDNVYFQPPASIKLTYPCIVYQYADEFERRANNQKYFGIDEYSVTVIDRDPESQIAKNVSKGLQMCSIGSYFVKDNLNHTTLRLYF